MNQWLQGDERMDQLLSHNLSIIQSPSVFSFSLDAVLLADFAQPAKHDRAKIVDLCAGNGVVGLLLSQKTSSSIIGIEIQERLVDMANRTIQMNDLADQVSIKHGDLSDATKWVKKDTVDTLTCNPPYFAVGEKKYKES